MKETQHQGTERISLHSAREYSWDDIGQPGAYVEKGTGDLFRIPKEALIRNHGNFPIITKESKGASRFIQVSRDPFVTSGEARMTSAQLNVQPNF
jgi:hypothetical protein